MNELKVASCFEFEKVLRGKSNKLFYPKSEVDAAIASKDAEIRRLKRALWLARAERAMAESYSVLNDVCTTNKWAKILNKLKAKAEEYK